MKKKEFKVDEVFQCGLVKLKVEKQTDYCEGCAFRDFGFCGDIHEFSGSCNGIEREDKTDVIFKKVEE